MKVESDQTWQPFERGYIEPEMLRFAGMAGAEVWVNNRYQVLIRVHGVFGDKPVRHLSIKRLDRLPVHDWRDLQRIKNELCGPECEGIEIYPAESRLVDEANQYHIFVFAEGLRIPFAFDQGRRVDYSTERNDGSRQREMA